MRSGENDFDASATPIRKREYNAGPSARHKSGNGTRRLLFFNLASVWGFIVGVAGLLAAMSAAGRPVQPGPGAIMGLIPAFVVAAAGGFVVSAAYKESKRRAR